MVATKQVVPPRVLVFGGRDYKDRTTMAKYLGTLPTNAIIVHGGARGADNLAGSVWKNIGDTEPEVHHADWNGPCGPTCTPGHRKKNTYDDKTYCPVAGFVRNQEMANSGIDYAIMFKGGSGTADMKVRLEIAGVRIIDVERGDTVAPPKPITRVKKPLPVAAIEPSLATPPRGVPKCPRHPNVPMQFYPERGAWKCNAKDCLIVKYPKTDDERKKPVVGIGTLSFVYDKTTEKLWIKSSDNVMIQVRVENAADSHNGNIYSAIGREDSGFGTTFNLDIVVDDLVVVNDSP